MPNRQCSHDGCPFVVKAIDTHSTCAFHSTCIAPPYFDPRSCNSCIELFNLAKSNPMSHKCWKSRIDRLLQHPEKPILHPDALDFELEETPELTEQEQPSAQIQTTNTSTNQHIQLKTLEILQRLDSKLDGRWQAPPTSSPDRWYSYDDEMEDPYVDEDSYMSEDPFLEDSRGEASCKLGDVFILPDDAEIHNTRIILQNAEISCAGDDRMVESFQQHNRFKIRILRTCPAIDAFLDKLLPYGSDEPHRKVSLPVSCLPTPVFYN